MRRAFNIGRCSGFAIVPALLACAAPVRADDVAKGHALAEKACAVCHLNPGQGEKTSIGVVPGFEAIARRPGQTFGGIVAWLRSMPAVMPDHRLTQDEMQALAAYILSLGDQPK